MTLIQVLVVLIVIIFLLAWTAAGLFWGMVTMLNTGKRTIFGKIVVFPVEAIFWSANVLSKVFDRK